ncbi:hypothetical protein V5799_003899 [Amblyomma americanum]|uniref:Uncharacterized protein n=1 Tax=Amblyomma americanum TaxID=6943 RepID=A0AAQ4D7M9_AMBAM
MDLYVVYAFSLRLTRFTLRALVRLPLSCTVPSATILFNFGCVRGPVITVFGCPAPRRGFCPGHGGRFVLKVNYGQHQNMAAN